MRLKPGFLPFGKLVDAGIENPDHLFTGHFSAEIKADIAILETEGIDPLPAKPPFVKSPHFIDHSGRQSRLQTVGDPAAQRFSLATDPQDQRRKRR